jgi:hypothetical protein
MAVPRPSSAAPPAHGCKEQRVAGEERRIVELVRHTFRGVTGGLADDQARGSERDRIAITERRERRGKPVGGRQGEGRPGLLGELARPREVVGVEVGLQHMGDAPAALSGQVKVDRRVKGRIDHRRNIAGADEVGEAALAGTTHLQYRCRAAGRRKLGGVPGQAPGPHPAHERARLQAARPELLGGSQAGATGGADRHHGCAGGNVDGGQSVRVAGLESVIGIDVDTTGDIPLGALSRRAHIQQRDQAPCIKPVLEDLSFNGQISRHRRSP